MKTANKFKYLGIVLTVIFGLFLTGCEDWFDINTSKDKPSKVPPDQSLPLLVFYASQICYDHAEYGVYLSQALTTGGRAQVSSYGYKSGWEFLSMNRHPQWRRHYYDIGVNGAELIKEAEKINSKNFILIARTIMLHSTLLTTDAFGDMPVKESYLLSYLPNSPFYSLTKSPAFDPQTDVYEWMLQEADELISLYNDPNWVNNPDNKTITKQMDRMFAGDLGKWGAFTKALKARILIRKLPNWDNTPETCQQIIGAVDEALGDPSYQDAIYKYDGGSAEKNCPWGPAQPKLNLGWAQARDNLLTEAIPSKFFAYALLGAYTSDYRYRYRGYALDPRAEKLMTPRQDDSNKKLIRFLENNIGMPTTMKITHFPDLYASEGNNPYTKNDGYIMLMSREELLFIKAEAQYWKGEKENAYNTTKEAVEVNMDRLGVPDDAKKQLFFDVRLPGSASFTIADLMQQKYVAMYLQPEQWTDVRRYNYSSETNGILYDKVPVYTVRGILKDEARNENIENYSVTFSLRRPYNLYEPYWCTADSYAGEGKNESQLSPNAWIMRLNYDPETEDKYNVETLQKLGAYKNPDWLKKRMIWAQKNNDKVSCSNDIPWK